MVEQVQYESLYLHFVQIREQTVDAINEKVDDELFVVRELVFLTLVNIDLSLDNVSAFNYLDQLLDDHALQFEPTHMSVIGHHCEDVSDYQ